MNRMRNSSFHQKSRIKRLIRAALSRDFVATRWFCLAFIVVSGASLLSTEVFKTYGFANNLANHATVGDWSVDVRRYHTVALHPLLVTSLGTAALMLAGLVVFTAISEKTIETTGVVFIMILATALSVACHLVYCTLWGVAQRIRLFSEADLPNWLHQALFKVDTWLASIFGGPPTALHGPAAIVYSVLVFATLGPDIAVRRWKVFLAAGAFALTDLSNLFTWAYEPNFAGPRIAGAVVGLGFVLMLWKDEI